MLQDLTRAARGSLDVKLCNLWPTFFFTITIDQKNLYRNIYVSQPGNPAFLSAKVPIESESEIVDMYVEVVQRNRSIRAAVIDHISSQSAIRGAIQYLLKDLEILLEISKYLSESV